MCKKFCTFPWRYSKKSWSNLYLMKYFWRVTNKTFNDHMYIILWFPQRKEETECVSWSLTTMTITKSTIQLWSLTNTIMTIVFVTLFICNAQWLKVYSSYVCTESFCTLTIQAWGSSHLEWYSKRHTEVIMLINIFHWDGKKIYKEKVD